jgi:hypothetical protein
MQFKRPVQRSLPPPSQDSRSITQQFNHFLSENKSNVPTRVKVSPETTFSQFVQNYGNSYYQKKMNQSHVNNLELKASNKKLPLKLNPVKNVQSQSNSNFSTVVASSLLHRQSLQ